MATKQTEFIVKIPFEVTVNKGGEKVLAKEGDILIVSHRSHECYNILKVNETPVYLTWRRKKYIEANCKN